MYIFTYQIIFFCLKGLTGLFALNDEQKFLTETESIFAILKQHVIELYNNIGKFQPFWNEKNQNDGQS